MPALKLCGRRLRMAGDDLGPYAILRLVMDAICMTLMLVASLRFRFWSGYPFSWGTAYVNGSFALFAVEAAVMVAMLIVSTRGGITSTGGVIMLDSFALRLDSADVGRDRLQPTRRQ